MGEAIRRAGRLLIPAAGVAAGLAFAGRRAGARPGTPYLAGAPLLIAHRGGSRLAPENTLLAFERAVSWWRADVLELDVHPTRDGEAVVIHDATLDRTTDGTGLVADHTLDELRRFDAGFRFTSDDGITFPFRGRGIGIPTLADVLRELPDVRVNIEIKDGRAQDAVWDAIRDAGAADRVLVAAGEARNRARLAGYPVPVSAGKEELRTFIAQLRLGRVVFPPRVDALQIPMTWEGREIASPALVLAAHRFNIAVHVWTVDETHEMARLLDWGVDGVITDRPDRLGKLLQKRCGRPASPGPADADREPHLDQLLRLG